MSLNTKDQLNMVIKTFKKLLSFKADKTELAEKIDRSEFEEEVSKHLVNSDWNAHEGEPGHIKNRTHYEYIDTTVLFDQDIILQPAMEEAQYYFKEPLPLVKGKLYTVSFESKEYGVSNIVDVFCNDGSVLKVFDATNIDINISSKHIGWYHGPQNAHFKIEEKEHIVKKIDEKFIPDSIKNAQADWEQNDESSSDYIKNRPFYTKEENGIISYYNENGFLCANLEEGKVYTVTLNGETYTDLICYSYYWYEQGGSVLTLGSPTPGDTNTWTYDFLLYQMKSDSTRQLRALCKEGSTFNFTVFTSAYSWGRNLTESDNVDILTTLEVVKQVDEKFIPIEASVVIINLNPEGDYYVSDKSYDEIIEAVNCGKSVFVSIADSLGYLYTGVNILLPFIGLTGNPPTIHFGSVFKRGAIYSYEAYITSRSIARVSAEYISNFQGANSNTSGSNGFVPAPPVNGQDRYLKGSGEWAEIPKPDSTLDKNSENPIMNKAVAEALEDLSASGGFVVQAEPPEDKSLLWVDTDDESEEVEIPQGGDSEWEILQDIELTEAATIKLDINDNKKDYIVVILVPKVDANLNTQASSFLGASGLLYYLAVGSTAYATMTVLHSIFIDETTQFQIMHQAYGPNDFKPNTIAAPMQTRGAFFKRVKNSALNIANTMPVGTKIRIYGR